MKLSSVLIFSTILVPLLLVAGVLPVAPQPLYLLRVSTTASVSEAYWVVDVNGGALREGDEIEAYFYNEAIALGASPHFRGSWNPQKLSSFVLSKLESDKVVFDGSLLNLNAAGSYGLHPVTAKGMKSLAAASVASFAAN